MSVAAIAGSGPPHFAVFHVAALTYGTAAILALGREFAIRPATSPADEPLDAGPDDEGPIEEAFEPVDTVSVAASVHRR